MNTTENVIAFKTRIETAPEVEKAPEKPAEVKGIVENNTEIPKALDAEIDRLDVWETENRRKYGEDFFKIRNIAHTFPIKAHFGSIDKFIRSEMKDRDMALTTKNYESIINEIENEIGTSKTETYKRLNRLFSYIQTLRRFREIKAKKEAFRISSE